MNAPLKEFRVDCYDSYVTVTPLPEAKVRDISALAKFVKDAVLDSLRQSQGAPDLKQWADGPFKCPNNPEHKLSWRGYHCEECGRFVGSPKSREEILTALITEREMHNAWRKRAEEAEAKLNALSA